MPSYSYECKNYKCKHQFKVSKPFDKVDDAEVCLKCSTEAKRVISSGVGMVLKGSGFHRNDYKV